MNEARRNQMALLVGTWGGVGLIPKVPGTAGSLVATLLFALARPTLGTDGLALLTLLVTGAGIWAAGHVANRYNTHDPQVVVIDEVAGQWLTLLAVPHDWRWYLCGFVVFRLTDQLKPWPARQAERDLPPAWGVMLDDVLAGAWGAVLLSLAQRWLPT